MRRQILVWCPLPNQSFPGEELLQSLRRGDLHFPWRSIWKFGVPPRMAFFSWCVALWKILTANNLRRIGTVIMEWCFMCKNYNWSSLFDILIMEYGKLKCQILKSSYDWSSLSSSFPIVGSQKTSFVFFCFSIVAFLFSFMIVLYSYVFCLCIQHLFFFNQ